MFGAAIATLVVVSACSTSGSAECGAGDYRFCDCPSGREGYAQCANDGSGYGACDCSGTIPAGAGVLVEAGSPDAADAQPMSPGTFLSTCSQDTDCLSGQCFAFNAYGLHCTKSCAKDLDCPAPSPGCSMMKVCKLH